MTKNMRKESDSAAATDGGLGDPVEEFSVDGDALLSRPNPAENYGGEYWRPQDTKLGKLELIISRLSLILLTHAGIIWAILAGILQSCQMIYFGKLAGIIIPMQILLVRSVSLLSLAPFISWDRDSSYNRTDLAANILFGFCDAVGISLAIVAMSIMSTSDASAIIFNVPLPAAFVAWILLGETFDLYDGALALINSVGLILICKGSLARGSKDDMTTSSTVLGLLLSFLGLFCFVLTPIAARFLAHRSTGDPFLFSFFAGCLGTIISIATLFLSDAWSLPKSENMEEAILYVLLLAILTILTFVTYGKALLKENALVVTVALTICIPITYVYDVLFNGIILIWVTFLGIIFTVGSTLLLTCKIIYGSP